MESEKTSPPVRDKVIFRYRLGKNLAIWERKILKENAWQACNDLVLLVWTLKPVLMAFHGDTIRANIVIDCTVLEQVSHFDYLGCNVTYVTNNDKLKAQIQPCVWDYQENSKISE